MRGQNRLFASALGPDYLWTALAYVGSQHLVAGQQRGSTSAVHRALNALVAN